MDFKKRVAIMSIFYKDLKAKCKKIFLQNSISKNISPHKIILAKKRSYLFKKCVNREIHQLIKKYFIIAKM